ncbi:MAG: LytR/AlgR family response regulator transcription factor [Thiohalomonadales bacterium]
MNILITDDESLARARMRRLIEEDTPHRIVGEAANGKQALLMCGQLTPDVILLDIRMPEMDGLETAYHLSILENPPAVIFTTAYSEHALVAFEREAVDYLLKPIRIERLELALQKAKKINRAQLQALENPAETRKGRTHISAQSGGSIQLIPVDEIYYFQAEQKYVTVRSKQGEVLIDEPLKSLEEEFGELFLRIHRNALVAIRHLDKLEKGIGQWKIQLRGIKQSLEVSRRHLTVVRKKLKQLKR